ncbi:tryptophan-rich sensory protein [bacterium]|nr:tryptophan-rich sensory protein [bacterium]
MFSLYVILAALIAGRIKATYHWQSGYTRKIFHFMIFTAAAVIQLIWSLPGVILFGGIVASVILWACFRKSQSPFYQSIARPKDAPHQTLFIIIPLISTALGGLLSNLLFHEYAVFGYLVAGWGDAAAEPVGIHWGKHPYSVPSLAGVKVLRSLEGSLALFITGIMSCILFMSLFFHQNPENILSVAFFCALTGTLVEAVSYHGLDNLTVQLAVSGMAFLIMN